MNFSQLLGILLPLLLTGCQLVKPFEPATIIHEDAHGGGSIVSFNQAETILASGGWAGIVRFWGLPNGTAQKQWQAHDDEITGIQFIQQDSAVVTASYEGNVKVWSTSTGELLRQTETLQPVRSMALDEAENLLVTGHVDGYVRLWSLDKLALIDTKKMHNSDIRAVAWSPETRTVAFSGFNSSVWLWPLDGTPVELPEPASDARTLTFADAGQTLLGGGWFNLFRWDLSNKTLSTISTEHAGIIRNMQLVEQGKSLATISRQTDSAVLFIDPTTGVVQRRFQPHALCGQDVSVSINNRFMATTSDDASVRIWWLKQSSKPNE